MNREPFIMLPRGVIEHITSSPETAGNLYMKHLSSEELYVVDRVQNATDSISPVDIPRAYTTLNWRVEQTACGQWFRVAGGEVNYWHYDLSRRPGTSVAFDELRQRVTGVSDPSNQLGFAITYDPDIPPELEKLGVSRFAGWLVARDGVSPAAMAIEPETLGLEQLEGKWPTERLATDTVMVVGLGSIGGVVATNLAAMGVGKSLLVDPDRFLWHNRVRHVLGDEAVGRHKVDAVRDCLAQDWPTHEGRALQYDVVAQAHLIRPLLNEVNLVVCAADGIAPRRVMSHLARRAGIPAVLVCVLDDGGIGEVLRLRPAPNFGCLLCHRAELAARGAIDPEADQELAYGTGHVHRPMTAIPTDLQTVGALAAKVAVATMLESRHGDPQRLAGEHAVIGLRANLGLRAPYDVQHVGEVSWHSIPPPRPACYTCHPVSNARS